MIEQVLFLVLVSTAVVLFSLRVKTIVRNIRLGRPLDRSDRRAERWMTMAKVAFGQTKMVVRPVPGMLHFLIYVGFVLINLEVLEIVVDGLFGTHRVFSAIGPVYGWLTASFEWLALGVLVACVAFLARRNVLKLRRFSGVEMTAWPRSDANYILVAEILLMSAFLTMNAADEALQVAGVAHYGAAGWFPVSSVLSPLLPQSEQALLVVERFCWWFHILGILVFLNYLPYSKHFHILLAFPNVWYSKLQPKGELTNMASVTGEVKAMLDPSFVPPAPAEGEVIRFGAKDVTDLPWKSLMEAYTCTECGRCTSQCPANITGKLLSPRKIMMDTRDRLTEVGRNLDQHGPGHDDGKALLDHYITREEIWACTTCNACTEACPVNIDPLAIITELRRYAVMEESKADTSVQNMFTNIENNGAPWKYSAGDRFNWKDA